MYGMIISMTALLIGFDIIVYHIISHAMIEQFDASLESAAHIISASVEWSNNKLDFEIDSKLTPEFAGNKTSAYYELWTDDGAVIKKSPSLGNDELIWHKPANHPLVFKSFVMKKSRRVRVVVISFLPNIENDTPDANNSPKPFVLAVARDAGDLLANLRFLKYLLSIASAGIIALACIIASAVVRRGLSPLSAVARQIDSIRDDNLKSRITGKNLPDEIVPIQRQLNNLLEHLEASFERERTFNANVAHELRTPLAGLKSIIDVTLTRSRDAAEYQTALSESLAIINDMEDMVSKLLMLTRIESGQMTSAREPINLAELVDKCWSSFSDKAAAAEIIYENNLGRNLVLNSDTAGLSIIFSNLLNNAAEYTNHGGRIWITAQKTENSIELIFENTGNQLTAQQVQSVFNYYWRGDAARSSTGVHSGLGLALTKRVVELLSGKIQADTPNGLFRIRIYLPLDESTGRQ
jgi:two-component system, OmpR family, heavy metal sensor histidine kinase CusS